MMGLHKPAQDTLFLYNICLEDRVRIDHPLRKIKELIDFDFIYKEVEDKYGYNGNVSVPPPVILKLMFLFFFYNVRSERELMETLPERLDWLWFLGYNLDSDIPDHSVLSKARKRWGCDAFKTFFENIVIQCVEKGLVDGTKIFMDASLIDANASNNSVVNTGYLNRSYLELEKRLEEKEGTINSRHISTTDPDASIVRHTGGKAGRADKHVALTDDGSFYPFKRWHHNGLSTRAPMSACDGSTYELVQGQKIYTKPLSWRRRLETAYKTGTEKHI